MAFVADSRIAHVWLRPGNAHTANNAIAFLRSSIQNLGSHKRVGLLRADSGLCDNALLEHLEQSKTAYTTAMRWVQSPCSMPCSVPVGGHCKSVMRQASSGQRLKVLSRPCKTLGARMNTGDLG